MYTTPSIMPYTKNETQVEQEGLPKIPILTEGDMTPERPELLQEFENGCIDYFCSKEVAEDKQTAKISRTMRSVLQGSGYSILSFII
jgi:hypothetical protein